MAKKYRVKLKNERVVGPFQEEQIAELFQKGHVSGQESFQEFPVGEWGNIKKFPELKKALLQKTKKTDESKPNKTGTIRQISKSRAAREEASKKPEEKSKEALKPSKESGSSSKDERGFSEFQYKKSGMTNTVDYREIKEKAHHKPKKVERQIGLEKTRVLKRPMNLEIEKTMVLKQNLPAIQEHDDEVTKTELYIEEQEEETKTQNFEEEKEEEDDGVDFDEATVAIDFEPNLIKINADAKIEEKKIRQEEKRLAPVEDVYEYDDDDDEEQDAEVSGGKRKSKYFIPLVMIIVVWFALFDEEEKPKGLDAPTAIVQLRPVIADVENTEEAKRLFLEAKKHYQDGGYKNLLLAASKFKASVEQKYQDNEAIYWLMKVYSETIEEASDQGSAIISFFWLIDRVRTVQYSNPLVSNAISRFYFKVEKYEAARKNIESFIRVGKPDLETFALYLQTLIEVGDIAQAQDVARKLVAVKNKTKSIYMALTDYYLADQKLDEAEALMREAGQKFGASVEVLIKYSDVLLKKEQIQAMAKSLKAISVQNAEGRPTYIADLFYKLGMVSAYEGNNEKAAQLFRQSLRYKESEELRVKLAQLDIGGTDLSQALIKESKVIDKIKESKEYASENDWQRAIIAASDAVDLKPNSIKANLHLADLQLTRGYFDAALTTLRSLLKVYPQNALVNTTLARALIKMEKLGEASDILISLRRSEAINRSAEFASVLGELNIAKRLYPRGIKNLARAVTINPLRDQDFYRLATLYFRARKYKPTKKYLNRAITLEPKNLIYQSMYADILYELEGAEAAIGFLKDLLKEHKEHPRLIGMIAIYYYKIGRAVDFKTYKERLERLNQKDASFYEFLIKAGKLEENFDQISEGFNKLIQLNPGNMTNRMEYGVYLFSISKYREALGEFQAAFDLLESYPTLNYYLAKCYINLKDLEKAMYHAELEKKHNPTREYGYYITGEVYRLQKKYNKAIKEFELAVVKNAKNVEVLMAMGWIKYQQNYLDKALDYYRRALTLERSNGEVHKQLGFIYEKSGQSTIAVEHFENYLSLMPDAKDKAQIQQRIRTLR